jgi:hypothetical protein
MLLVFILYVCTLVLGMKYSRTKKILNVQPRAIQAEKSSETTLGPLIKSNNIRFGCLLHPPLPSIHTVPGFGRSRISYQTQPPIHFCQIYPATTSKLEDGCKFNIIKLLHAITFKEQETNHNKPILTTIRGRNNPKLKINPPPLHRSAHTLKLHRIISYRIRSYQGIM